MPKGLAETITIEPVNPNELAELGEVATNSYVDAFAHIMSPDDLDRLVTWGRTADYFARTLPSSHVLVAKLGGKIVSYTQFGDVKIPGIASAPQDRELGRLYVDTSLHGKGIGRQLLEAALEHSSMKAAPNIYLQVWEHNEKALPLYTSYGFATSGYTHFKLHNRPARDMIMVRRQLPAPTL